MIKNLTIKTKKNTEVIDITSEIRELIFGAGLKEGICYIYVPHTTAGITINEGADPDVMRDFLAKLNELVPADGHYLHSEGNSAAHIKASMVGSSAIVMVENGIPVLGTWQSVYLCEFDGPRERKVAVKIVKG